MDAQAMGQNGSAVKIDEAKLHELLSAKARPSGDPLRADATVSDAACPALADATPDATVSHCYCCFRH